MSASNHDLFALGGVQDDPIFPLIEEWRQNQPEKSRLYAAWEAAGLDENHQTHAPYHAAWERFSELCEPFRATCPTTIRGVSALLRFTREIDDDGVREDCIERATDALHDLVERGAA